MHLPKLAARVLGERRGMALLDLAVALLVLSVAFLGTLAATSATAGGVERSRRVSAAALAAQDEMEAWINRPFVQVVIGAHPCTVAPPPGLSCSVDVTAVATEPGGIAVRRVSVTLTGGDGAVVYSAAGFVADGT